MTTPNQRRARKRAGIGKNPVPWTESQYREFNPIYNTRAPNSVNTPGINTVYEAMGALAAGGDVLAESKLPGTGAGANVLRGGSMALEAFYQNFTPWVQLAQMFAPGNPAVAMAAQLLGGPGGAAPLFGGPEEPNPYKETVRGKPTASNRARNRPQRKGGRKNTNKRDMRRRK